MIDNTTLGWVYSTVTYVVLNSVSRVGEIVSFGSHNKFILKSAFRNLFLRKLTNCSAFIIDSTWHSNLQLNTVKNQCFYQRFYDKLDSYLIPLLNNCSPSQFVEILNN